MFFSVSGKKTISNKSEDIKILKSDLLYLKEVKNYVFDWLPYF